MASSSNRWLLQGSIGRTGLTHDFFHLPAAFKKSFLNVALYSSLYSSYCVANTSTEALLDLNCNKIQMFIFCLLLSSQSGRQLRYRWLDPARCTTVRRTATAYNVIRHKLHHDVPYICATLQLTILLYRYSYTADEVSWYNRSAHYTWIGSDGVCLHDYGYALLVGKMRKKGIDNYSGRSAIHC